MGSNFAACLAGNTPNNKPIPPDTPTAKAMVLMDMLVGKGDTMPITVKPHDIHDSNSSY